MEPDNELEHYLQHAPILYVGAFERGGAHPEKRLVVLEGGVATLAKPAVSGHPDAATCANCEVAGWVLARALGWTDLVATTIMRPIQIDEDGDEIDASLQVVWHALEAAGERNATPSSCDERQCWQVAVFDAICRNTDRNEGNWGFIRNDSRVRLLDHGYAFEQWPGRTPLSAFVDHVGDDEVPGDLREDVEMFLDAPRESLQEVLSADARSAVYERAQHVAEVGILPRL